MYIAELTDNGRVVGNGLVKYHGVSTVEAVDFGEDDGIDLHRYRRNQSEARKAELNKWLLE